ncbi:MAG: transposase [Actinobacteria bacterium]|nr:transposase [Actinomycetota bacterium]
MIRLIKTRDRRSHKIIIKRRRFSNDFKKKLVESILLGSSTHSELAREHRISLVMIKRWKKDYKKGKFF